MFILGGTILGAILGAAIALRRGGRKLDALQYGAAFAIIFTLLGLFLTIILHRTMAG